MESAPASRCGCILRKGSSVNDLNTPCVHPPKYYPLVPVEDVDGFLLHGTLPDGWEDACDPNTLPAIPSPGKTFIVVERKQRLPKKQLAAAASAQIVADTMNRVLDDEFRGSPRVSSVWQTAVHRIVKNATKKEALAPSTRNFRFLVECDVDIVQDLIWLCNRISHGLSPYTVHLAPDIDKAWTRLTRRIAGVTTVASTGVAVSAVSGGLAPPPPAANAAAAPATATGSASSKPAKVRTGVPKSVASGRASMPQSVTGPSPSVAAPSTKSPLHNPSSHNQSTASSRLAPSAPVDPIASSVVSSQYLPANPVPSSIGVTSTANIRAATSPLNPSSTRRTTTSSHVAPSAPVAPIASSGDTSSRRPANPAPSSNASGPGPANARLPAVPSASSTKLPSTTVQSSMSMGMRTANAGAVSAVDNRKGTEEVDPRKQVGATHTAASSVHDVVVKSIPAAKHIESSGPQGVLIGSSGTHHLDTSSAEPVLPTLAHPSLRKPFPFKMKKRVAASNTNDNAANTPTASSTGAQHADVPRSSPRRGDVSPAPEAFTSGIGLGLGLDLGTSFDNDSAIAARNTGPAPPRAVANPQPTLEQQSPKEASTSGQTRDYARDLGFDSSIFTLVSPKMPSASTFERSRNRSLVAASVSIDPSNPSYVDDAPPMSEPTAGIGLGLDLGIALQNDSVVVPSIASPALANSGPSPNSSTPKQKLFKDAGVQAGGYDNGFDWSVFTLVSPTMPPAPAVPGSRKRGSGTPLSGHQASRARFEGPGQMVTVPLASVQPFLCPNGIWRVQPVWFDDWSVA